MRLALFAAALLATGPASAQELFGVHIGDTTAAAQAAMPEAKLSSEPARPRQAMLYDAKRDRLVGFCDGRVYSIQEQFGSSLHDFAAEAKTETLARGPGRPTVRNIRTTSGEMSSFSLSWPEGAVRYELNLFQPADAPLQATRQLFNPQAC